MSENLGRTLGGRYEICQRIGAGGTGTVCRARDLLLDRDVAVKLLRPGQDATARARLRAEARIAARFSHSSIASVLDYGEDVVDGEPCPYLVMEYVDGVTLRDVLRDGPLPPDRVADLVADVAEALDVAHAAGVVHRDVKPSNIMLTVGGAAALLDFGIARHAGHEPLTVTGSIVGTVDYISPEQAAGRSASARSDLYALGMVAHEALTGRRALTRDTPVATLLAHATEDVEPLPDDVPEGLRRLVEQLLQRDPSRRPADAATVVRRARAAASDGQPASAPLSRPRRHRGDRRSGALLVVGVIALVLAGLGTVLSRGSGDVPTIAAHGAGTVGHRAAGISILGATGQGSASVVAAAPPTIAQVVTTRPVGSHVAPPRHHRGKAHGARGASAAAHAKGNGHGKAHPGGRGSNSRHHGRGHHKH